jgi:hypothetical protein
MRKKARKADATQASPSGLIDQACFCTGSNRSDRRKLCLTHRFVNRPHVPARPTKVHRPRQVRTITAEYNTEVQNDEAAPWNRLVRSASMGQSRSGPRGYNRIKGHSLRTGMARCVLQFSSN